MIIKASCPLFPFHSYSCIVLPFYSFQDEQSKICKYMPFPYLKSSYDILSHWEEYIQLYSLCCGLHSPWPMFWGLFLWPHSVALTFIFKLNLTCSVASYFSSRTTKTFPPQRLCILFLKHFQSLVHSDISLNVTSLLNHSLKTLSSMDLTKILFS